MLEKKTGDECAIHSLNTNTLSHTNKDCRCTSQRETYVHNLIAWVMYLLMHLASLFNKCKLTSIIHDAPLCQPFFGLTYPAKVICFTSVSNMINHYFFSVSTFVLLSLQYQCSYFGLQPLNFLFQYVNPFLGCIAFHLLTEYK